jgi:exonuclease III
MMAKITTINVRGVQTDEKQKQFISYLEDSDTDILFVQECNVSNTKLKKKYEEVWGGITYWNSSGKHTIGTAIMVKPKLMKQITKTGVILQGRAQFIDISIENKVMRLINLYGISKEDVKEREKVYTEIYKFLDKNLEIILAGDFNSIRTSIDTTNKNRKALNCDLKFYEMLNKNYNLFDLCESKEDMPSYTYRYKKGASRIDKIYTCQEIKMRVRNIKYAQPAMTDHDSITIEIHLKDKIRWGPGVWKLNNSLLKDEQLKKIVKSVLQHATTVKAKIGNIKIWWDLVKKILKKNIRDYAKRKARWKRGELDGLKIDLEKKCIEHDRRPTCETWTTIEEIKKKIYQKDKLEKAKAWVLSREQVKKYDERSTKFFYDRIRKQEEKKNIYAI